VVVHKSFHDVESSEADQDRTREQFCGPVQMPPLRGAPQNEKAGHNEQVRRAFPIVPKDLFLKMSQEPQGLFDPTDDQLRETSKILEVIYDEPDPTVLFITLFNAGEKQALSHVYEQGFIAGRQRGYVEGIQQLQTVLSGK